MTEAHGLMWDEATSALAELHAELGRHLTGPEPTAEKLSDVLRMAVSRVPGAEGSSIVRARPGVLRTLASTDSGATVVDKIQIDSNSGPCVDVLLDGTMSGTDDVRTDPRWPQFAQLVAGLSPVRSVLSFRLPSEDEALVAGLNLYSTRPAAFDRHGAELGTLLATHAASVVAAAGARENALQLHHALSSNRDIGTAMGVLMAQHKIRRDQAFDLLRLASQNSNRRLIDIAADVLETGTLDIPVRSPTRAPARRMGTRSADVLDRRVPAEMPGHPVAKVGVAAPNVPARRPGNPEAVGEAARLNDAERLHRLEGLIEALSGAVTVTEVADVLWREGPLAAGVIATGLAIVDAGGRRINFVPSAGHLHSPPARWASAALTDDLPVAEAARRTAPLYFSEPSALLGRYPALEEAQTATGDGSWAIVPLTGPDTPQGVLTLAWPRPRSFSDGEKDFIATLGLLCSAALGRAFLREERDRLTAVLRPR